MNDYLKTYETKLEALEAKMKHIADENLVQKRRQFEAKLAELRGLASDRWELLQAGLEIAWSDLVETYEAVSAKPSASELKRNQTPTRNERTP